MTWSLFPFGSSVSVCDLGTLVVESRVKVEPTGPSVWPDVRPHFLLLPGQRGRQSGASGVLWSLGLVESSLQDKTHDLICLFYRIIFRFRAHLVIPQTAALCSVITS